MSILLLYSNESGHSRFLKSLYSTPNQVLIAHTLPEAIGQLSQNSDLDTVLIPPTLTDGSSGLQVAERLGQAAQATQILLLNPTAPPHNQKLPDYLHGQAHYSVDPLHLQLIIEQARERLRLQQELQALRQFLLIEEGRTRFLTSVLDTLSCPVVTLTPQLRIISMNTAGCKLIGAQQHSHGRTLSSLLNSNVHHTTHPTVQAIRSLTRHSSVQKLPGIGHSLLITSIPVTSPGGSELDYVVEIWEPADRIAHSFQPPLSSRHTQTGDSNPRPAAIAKLTPREWEIIPLLQRGDSYRRIAEQLGVSQNTVKSHISTIYRKTKCRGRTELIRMLQNHCP